MSARWLNAWGVLPRCRPVAGSISSANRPRGLANATSRSNRARARSRLADTGERRHQPEGADGEAPLLRRRHSVVRLVRAVAQHEAILGQLVRDGQHGRPDTRVRPRQEPHQRHQQQRRVQGGRAIGLGEHASSVDPLTQQVIADGGRLGRPAARGVSVPASPGDPPGPVQGDPCHELGGPEMAGRATDLPDALVREPPVLGRLGGQPLDDGPGAVVHGHVPTRQVTLEQQQQPTPHVVLALMDRAVADPDRPGTLVAAEMVEGRFGQLSLAADAVHHLERRLIQAVGEEAEEGACLLAEAEVLEGRHRAHAVADPGVAVVPVATATGRFGQGRRCGRHHGARSVRTPAP